MLNESFAFCICFVFALYTQPLSTKISVENCLLFLYYDSFNPTNIVKVLQETFYAPCFFLSFLSVNCHSL